MPDRQSPLDAELSAALRARQAGHRSDELRHLDAALRIAPSDPRALNARGVRALSDQDGAGARNFFAAAAQADSKEPALWMNLAAAHRLLGDDAGEADALERALSLDRLHFMANLRMAELDQRCGRTAKAAQGWSGVVQMALSMQDRPPGVADALRRGQAFLAQHNDRLARALDEALGAELARLGTAGRRFGACVDHLLGRRAIYKNECHGIYFPFLPADEFFDRQHFPWLDQIEARTDAIRAEALALLRDGGEAIRPYVRQDPGTPQNKWSALDHSLAWSACFLWEYGEPNEAVCARCPETVAALEAAPRNRIPGKAPSAFFSILAPKAHIPPHTGVTNTRAIVHLPLVVPSGCRFRVGGETREWREGEAFAFDDTIEHEAWNDSAEPRIVLIFDVWNPHLTIEEQGLLQSFYEISDARG
ncbi:aspartyl/asparaginyl beta-hydroxylase domain-containing protein [Erythrobacter sp. WG]|uniref:aspartyl/asparaginyl beta-hydroxylase domain-containing protein n=1 Tax=Erythrobacter sp. WG TaxID=2985510 RepID=UPI00226FC237|nr:aspartyl/asparaginyl beta-hydroxylase domain-containing protein [Erythrobacter sp. WG]MCX9147765.1 aspartyl/asparaginyl beta-hydroxylase domain-containing protein [Erythrobacter sp. WG]